MEEIFQHRVNSLPTIAIPGHIYYVKNGQGNNLDHYVTDNNGILRLVGKISSNGLSAYQIAVQNGYVGTEQQWLASLQGSGGGGSIQNYVHQQAIPSDTWIINHNLGFKPNVSIVDTVDDEVEGSIKYTNLNTITITFALSFSGKAYLS